MKNPCEQSPPLVDAATDQIKQSVRRLENIDVLDEMTLNTLPAESRNVVVVSTRFDVRDKIAAAAPRHYQLSASAERLLRESVRILRFGGLLFVYGIPHDLVYWGERLSTMQDGTQDIVFKNWIALDIDDAPRANFFKPSHQGLLMYLKSKPGTKGASRFLPNYSDLRMPHQQCSSRKEPLTDYGGKEENRHPKGTVLSDVWRDLTRRPIQDCTIPADVLERILALTKHSGGSYAHILQQTTSIEIATPNEPEAPGPQPQRGSSQFENLEQVEPNEVHHGDCVSFLKRVRTLNPKVVFDMAFADPAYNLGKRYESYEDTLADPIYIKKYNAWLEDMVETLKPGASLFWLTLPKGAIHHAAFLNRRLEFRHWIVWDASAEPRNPHTFRPSHYALLYYTKPGGNPTVNYAPLGSPAMEGYVLPADASNYCLRPKCLKLRKEGGDDKKVELSDVWFDIQRNRHKEIGTKHPCRLPVNLMERLVLLTTRRGELGFDPCFGTGTTAIAATKLNRNYVVVEKSIKYVRITLGKLAALREHFRLNGNYDMPQKKGRKRRRRLWSRAKIVRCLKQLARILGRVPTENDIDSDDPKMLKRIDSAFPSRGAALKRCKLALAEGN